MRSLLAVCLLLFSGIGVAAPTTSAERIAAIEKSVLPTLIIKGQPAPTVTLADRMEQLKVRGISIAVFNHGAVEWTKAYGYADKERAIPATPATLFEAGSISKSVLEPLGMRSSTYEQPLPDKWHARAASGYTHEGVKLAGEWHVYPEMAAAGLWTTGADLAKYALALQRMNAGAGGILSQRMAHTMLTPGMHDDGLGVFITPDGKRFGHEGADDGFQSSLTAFIDGGAGIAILTNSDNGARLAHELMLTIAREYGWSGFQQTEKTVAHLSEPDLARVSGHYTVDAGGAGEFDLVAQGERIILKSSVMRDRELLAESRDRFFIRDDGTPVEIVSHDGTTALTIGGGLHAVKAQR